MANDSITASFLCFAPQGLLPPISHDDLKRIEALQHSTTYRYVDIEGLPGGKHAVLIGEDLEELVAGYMRLENQAQAGKFERHTVFLSDGGLLMHADLTPERASIHITRSPYLNRSIASEYQLEVPTMDYVGAWRAVAHDLLAAATE